MKYLKLFLIFFFSFLFVLEANAEENLSISPIKFEFDINKSTFVKDKIKVTNSGDETITVYSSKEDFIAGDDTGAPTFIKPEDQDNPGYTLANWIKIEDQNVTLSPGESKEVSFTITVPSNAEPGGHYAGVFFSPGVKNGGQIAVVKRLGVLLLINVPGEVNIEGNLKSFKIGDLDSSKKFQEENSFSGFPITFQTIFQNSGNVHLKPTGKITLVDEKGEILKNVGKITLSSPAGAYIGEQMVDYIPVNDVGSNVLPKSDRRFENIWEGFGYNVLNEKDGTKGVKFKTLSEYYAEKTGEEAKYLKFWQEEKSKTVKKKITAKYELSYTGKDKEVKNFNESRDFYVTYDEKYIGLNLFLVGGLGGIIVLIILYFVLIAPKQKKKKEEEIRQKLMQEMQNKNN